MADHTEELLVTHRFRVVRHVQTGPDGAEHVKETIQHPGAVAILPLLDSRDPLVEVVGAANTVLLGPQGRRGANTDVPGLVAGLAERGVTRAEEATVLGGGATACSALAALAMITFTEMPVTTP